MDWNFRKSAYLNLTHTQEGSTILFSAAEGGNLDIVKYLVENGVDPNVIDTVCWVFVAAIFL